MLNIDLIRFSNASTQLYLVNIYTHIMYCIAVSVSYGYQSYAEGYVIFTDSLLKAMGRESIDASQFTLE